MKTIGFLSMRFEEEEKRDFRPGFFANLRDLPNPIILDESYGKKLGYSRQDYLKLNPNLNFCDRKCVLESDIVISVRTPVDDELKYMKKGAALFSMLHFVTHERRNNLLKDMGVTMYAMDSVVDDFGHRMIQDFPGTVKSALSSGFSLLNINELKDECNVLIIGTGELAKLAVDYAVKLSPVPAIVTSVGKSITQNKLKMRELLTNCDLLIDASKRIETHKYIIDNDMLGVLPNHAVIVDISADDYDISVSPIQVKGVEGIPTGNLRQYLFMPNDSVYERIPSTVNTQYRRKVASCYSWPGVDYHACLDRYEQQISPFVHELVRLNTQAPKKESRNYLERALFRSSYDFFRQST
ncbi:MAG: hypothetical protein WCY21_01060 [Candidatus Cloacimonadaceae bacterium]|jgi:alanine dehydrogenase|nr:hypothetical protein [Candidatus Cloacimonadota bacterium]MDX9948961.1 hypothetical protein [Candidatus Syntrophosphaera sp.]